MFGGTLAAHGGVRATERVRVRAGRPGARPQDRPRLSGEEPADPGMMRMITCRREPMPMNKPHLEFTRVDMRDRLGHAAGLPAGHQAEDPRQRPRRDAARWEAARGSCASTRAPTRPRRSCTTIGKRSTSCPAISSSATTRAARAARAFEAPTYACRPPGVYHGPFKSERGCLMYEIHYYDESKK